MGKSDLNDELQRLAMAAREFPPSDPRRRKHLSQLISGVQSAKGLKRPTTATVDRRHPAYDDIYDEACSDLWIWACERIDDYDETRSPVLGWLNFYLSRRFFPEAAKRVLDFNGRRIGPGDRENDRFWENLADEAPRDLEEGEGDDYATLIRQYLESSEDSFLNDTIQNLSEANLRTIVDLKLQGKTLQEIGTILGSNYSTVHSFYRRRRQRLFEAIRRYCDERH